MRTLSIRSFSSHGLLAVLLAVSTLGCLTKVNSEAGNQGAKCTSDKNCREGLVCDLGTGLCQKSAAGDAGRSDGSAIKADGSSDSSDSRGAGSDGKTDLLTVRLDTNTATDSKAPDDSAIVEDAPGATPDAPGAIPATQPDAPAAAPDAPALQPDALGSPDTRPADTNKPDTLPCNGGCCSNADCPLNTPVCNGANQCIGCTADPDCTGRPMTACKTSTGACVQCTQKSHCGGTTSSCDTTTNQCVGCTNRNDCLGTCQTCSNGSCVPVKNADDPGKCAGTCDNAGECKAKQGQKCTDVTGGCISGSTCADGYCCNRACSGTCEACDVDSKQGTCTVISAGSQPRHGTCANTGAGVANTACAGSCQGKSDGSCSYAPTSTACGSAGCNPSGQSQAAGTCNGTGLCSMPAPISCKTGGTCSAGGCSCPASLPNECGNACVDIKTDNKNCGACSHDCLGGTCLGGLCQPVVVAKPTSQGIRIFGLDSQHLYYTSGVTPVSAESYRISINALAGTGTPLRGETSTMAVGVIGENVYFNLGRGESPSSCRASDCVNTLAPLANVASAFMIPFGNPSPDNYPAWETDPVTSYLRITWYDTQNRVAASWPDVSPPDGDSGFHAFGNSVYWVRQVGTDISLYSVDSTELDLKRMAGQLLGVYNIININSYSILLLYFPNLYRVPRPLGLGNSTPTEILSGTGLDIQQAIEDATFLYWADSAGAIYRCPTNDLANCKDKKVLLTTSAATTGFFQDTNNLYWGTLGTPENPNGKLLRMAK
jgi:hypothetical protein